MHVVFVDRAGAKSIWELMGHVAKRCIEQGGRATFVIWDDGCQSYTQDVPEGVEVITIRVPPKRFIWDLVRQHGVFVRELRKVLRRLKPDIVHTNFAVPSIVARWAAAKEHVPVIVSTQHELYSSMHPHYRWGLRLTERYCDAITYVSRTVAESFDRRSEVTSSEQHARHPRHFVIPNGVDIDKIRTAIANVEGRVPGRIVCAGRMVPVKGQRLLIEALPQVVRCHPHVQLHLIGSGPMEEALRQRVKELGLTDSVVFMGWQPHDALLQEMAAAELVVVPSDGSQEGFGLVVAEALVCGTPLLVSDIPVFREVLDGFHDRARLFSSGDGQCLTNALVEYPFTGSGKQPNIPVAPLIEFEKLSANAMTDAYIRLYQDLTLGSN
jgi:glycosyltransferase involved in cell wall biosynthesis